VKSIHEISAYFNREKEQDENQVVQKFRTTADDIMKIVFNLPTENINP
jgi:hypothetical protein